MPIEIVTAFEQVVGAMVLEGYGLSESLSGGLVQSAGPPPCGLVGTPISGVEFRRR